VLSAAPDFLSDTHVHSTFSDGRDTIEENVAQARRRGLHRICLVDHVRTTTTWVGDFVAATQALAATDRGSHEVPLEILRGVETKVLDQKGGLDLPADLGGLDRILVADHQFPMADGPHHPKEVEADRAAGRYRDAELADVLIESVGNSLQPSQAAASSPTCSACCRRSGWQRPTSRPPGSTGWLTSASPSTWHSR